MTDRSPVDADVEPFVRGPVPGRVLITGASIAGLAAAFWLERTGWHVEVVERAPAFRSGGQNVDVRGAAREVVDRMGLTAAVRDRTTTEVGTRFVDADGAVVGEFRAEPGDDGPTAELEILRGDLAALIGDALGDEVGLRYGDSITAVTDDADAGEVVVEFASGRTGRYDLVVVAEGVRSTTRDLVFGDEVKHHPLGLSMVYGTIERRDTDDRWWNWYTATRSRQVTIRPDNRGTVRATLAHLSDEDRLTGVGAEERIAVLREVFTDAGWQTERVLDGFASSDEVYVDHLTQIRMPRWSTGRVVITGDAAWCVTPLGGGGSSLALLGGYVLAASLSTTVDRPAALARYEAWLRPVVENTQSLPPGVPGLAYPSSALGVKAGQLAVRLAGTRPVRSVVGRLMGGTARSEQELPPLITRARPATDRPAE